MNTRYVPLQSVYDDAVDGHLGPKAQALAELLGLIAGANVRMITDGDQLVIGIIVEEMDRVASILLSNDKQQDNEYQEVQE